MKLIVSYYFSRLIYYYYFFLITDFFFTLNPTFTVLLGIQLFTTMASVFKSSNSQIISFWDDMTSLTLWRMNISNHRRNKKKRIKAIERFIQNCLCHPFGDPSAWGGIRTKVLLRKLSPLFGRVFCQTLSSVQVLFCFVFFPFVSFFLFLILVLLGKEWEVGR